jgi:hypothetical protein
VDTEEGLDEAELLLYREDGAGAEETRRLWGPTGRLIGPDDVDGVMLAAAAMISYLTAGWDQLHDGAAEAERIAQRLMGRPVDGVPLAAVWHGRLAAQCGLLRDIFGNPFRPLTAPPGGLPWNAGVVPKLAQAIYDERAFDRLPILADALEEAGCDDRDILAHCRGGSEHVHGCWVVDLSLGKS